MLQNNKLIKTRRLLRSAATYFAVIRSDKNADGVKKAYDNLQAEVKLRRACRGASKQFSQLSDKHGLNLHLGCGSDVRQGWVNVDLTLDVPTQLGKETFFINHDLREGLPLAPESCRFIYSSHFFEHLELKHGIGLMRDCYRALEPGGVFRIVLPDLPLLFSRYLDGNSSFFDLIERTGVAQEGEPGTKSLIDCINYGVYQFGEHKQIYDKEKLNLILKRIGFRSVTTSVHKDGMDPNVDLRLQYSFYMEATK